MVKKIRFSLNDDDYAKDVSVWILNSPHREYKVVSLLNRLLESSFYHVLDYEHLDTRTSRYYLYPVYANSSGKAWLIGNRTEEVYLIPEFKPYNTILCLTKDEDAMTLMDNVRNSGFFTHVLEIIPENYPKAMEIILKILFEVEE